MARNAPTWVGHVGLAIAVVYLAALPLDTVWPRLAARLLPDTFHYFTQAAALFPYRQTEAIEWHVEVYRCDLRRFVEADVRPLFPGHETDKENRLDRALHFFHGRPDVLATLDDYVVAAVNANPPAFGRIGGVLFESIRVPIPEVGSDFPPYHTHPIATTPLAWRRVWYTTDSHLRDDRCDALARTP